jgi:hypothetical protein
MRRKRGKDSIEAIATEFVNDIRAAQSDLMSHPSLGFAAVGRQRWLRAPRRNKTFAEIAQELHSPQNQKRLETRSRNLAEIRQALIGKKWATRLRKAWDKPEDAKRICKKILAPERLLGGQLYRGSGEIVVGQIRDELDLIADVILRASQSGRLRICEGHENGWDCPTPYLVADEGRRTHCYMQCGAEAKRRSKLRSWHTNKSKWRPS